MEAQEGRMLDFSLYLINKQYSDPKRKCILMLGLCGLWTLATQLVGCRNLNIDIAFGNLDEGAH